MKVLLDEDLPHQLRLLISGHDVFTVKYVGWKGLKNGALLGAAEAAGHDVFVTGDQNLPDQQNRKGRRMGLVVLSAQKIRELRPHIRKIEEAVDRSGPESIQFVDCSVLREQ